MSWRLWPSRNELASHQIRLSFNKNEKGVLHVAVSCACRRLGHGINHFDPIAFLNDDGESPWPYYNDPANHIGPVPFTHDMQGGSFMDRYKEEDKWSTQQ